MSAPIWRHGRSSRQAIATKRSLWLQNLDRNIAAEHLGDRAHESSASLFAATGRPLSPCAPRGDGAPDQNARRTIEFRTATIERGILCAARHVGRIADRR